MVVTASCKCKPWLVLASDFNMNFSFLGPKRDDQECLLTHPEIKANDSILLFLLLGNPPLKKASVQLVVTG